MAGLLISISGCAVSRPSTTINDCGGDGYRVVAVDGKPEVRWHHPIHSVVPVVIVEPGEHTLTIQPVGTDQTFEVTTTFAPHVSYRVADVVACVKPVPAGDASSER